jgi:hypothetical protein
MDLDARFLAGFFVRARGLSDRMVPCCCGGKRSIAAINSFVFVISSLDFFAMKPDLSMPRAKLNWANNQIEILKSDIRKYGEREPYKIVTKPNTGGKGVLCYLEVVEPIPDLISAHVGAILEGQRGCLDFLVTALAEKNGAIEPRDCYFPIADCEQAFLEGRTQKKIKRLAPEDRKVIHALKPYKGGNDLLYALNWLNNKGKHRKLIPVAKQARMVEISGHALIQQRAEWSPDDVNAGAPVAAIHAIGPSPGVDPEIKLKLAVDIGFGKVTDATPARPVVPALREFSSLAASIIDRFD